MAKRTHEDMEGGPPQTGTSPFMPMFEQFRAELDEHHDRRERITKASRDVTAASKKIIFTLQRVRKLNGPLPQHVVKGNKPFYDAISTNFSNITKDLQGINAYRYARQISGGRQEYMEAITFEHYLKTASLITYDEAAALQRNMSDSEGGPGVGLTHEDYLLGVYDMTGELMRFAITAMATSGELPMISSADSQGPQRSVLNDMRGLRAALEALNAHGGPLGRDVDMKMKVMRQSVEKVEKSLYGLVVRGAERPKGWMPDADTGPKFVDVEG